MYRRSAQVVIKGSFFAKDSIKLRSFSTLQTNRFAQSPNQSRYLRNTYATGVFTKTHSTHLISNRPFFSLFTSKLSKLQQEANDNPSDASKQSELLQELNNQLRYEDVVTRFESGAYALNQEAKREYIKSLILLNKYDHAKVEQLFASYQAGSLGKDQETTGSTSNPKPEDGTKVPSAPMKVLNFSEPLQVHLVTTPSSKFWSFVRFAILAGLSAGFLYWVISSEKKGSGNMPFQIAPAHQEVWNVETKFGDVKGVDEAKDELQEIVEYLKNPQKFTKLGARLPKGVLLVGEPGTGKTLLARALAGEAGVPFLYTSGSSFDEMFVGVGPKRIRSLFEDAKKLAPCLIFIDEIDSVGSNRKYTQMSSSARESTLNQLLTEMDGFKATQGIVVIGATNFPESLDPALSRPGRFDKQVEVPVPDVKGRKEIIEHYLQKTVVASTVDSLTLAKGTPGFTGADLANLINIAAIKATMQGKEQVDNHSIEEAKDQVLMGLAKKNGDMDPYTRKVTAYHEGGHALVALYLKDQGSIPLHKATIIQRGSALGVTVMLPEKDDLLMSRKKLMASMAVSMGGRAAEELIFGPDEITGGASSDFQSATSVAFQMVSRLGMSAKVGKISHNLASERGKMLSERERELIDNEVRELLEHSYEQAKTILKTHEQELHRLANALLEYETLSVDEIKLVIAGNKLNKQL